MWKRALDPTVILASRVAFRPETRRLAMFLPQPRAYILQRLDIVTLTRRGQNSRIHLHACGKLKRQQYYPPSFRVLP